MAGSFLSGFAEGFSSARGRRQQRKAAELSAAKEAFNQSLDLKKLDLQERNLQLEKEKSEYQKQQDQQRMEFEKEKHSYEKEKDTKEFEYKGKTFDLDIKKYESEAEFKKAQQHKMEMETKRMAQQMTKEELETQFSYFATWASLPPEHQTEKVKEILIKDAHSNKLISDKRMEDLMKMPVPVFHQVARAGLGMSANALNALKYLKPEADTGKTQGFEEGLRKEFTSLNKDYQTQYNAYKRIQISAEKPSAAGDLALIFNYMKLLDPGSTVREGEFATAQNAAGLPERVRAMYNKAINGERLTEETRKDFVERSDMLYSSAKKGYENLKKTYIGIAERNKLNPQNVIVDYEGQQESPQASTTSFKLPSGTVIDQATVIERAKSLGLSPEEALQRLKAAGATPMGEK